MTNKDVRVAAMSAGVPLWRIAEELGIADTSLSRKLRRELPADEQKQILEIIDRLSQGVAL